jgi:hypothetical protein
MPSSRKITMKKLFLALFLLFGLFAESASAYTMIEGGMRIFLTKDPAGMVDGPNLYTYVKQNPWTNFDPEGLQTLDDTRKQGVTVQSASNTQFKPGEAEAVLKQHGEKVTKPGDVSDDRVKELSGEDQYKGKSSDEIRVSESARANAINAKWALLKYEATPATRKAFAAWDGMNDILLTTTMAVPGVRGIGMGTTTEVGQTAAAAVKYEGLTAEQKLLVQQAMRKAGIADTNLLIKGADMPTGYSGMTLGDEGFVINRSVIKDPKELLETVKHEYQHIVDRRALGDPGAYGQDLEDKANAAEKH